MQDLGRHEEAVEMYKHALQLAQAKAQQQEKQEKQEEEEEEEAEELGAQDDQKSERDSESSSRNNKNKKTNKISGQVPGKYSAALYNLADALRDMGKPLAAVLAVQGA